MKPLLLEMTASGVWNKIWTVALALLFFGLMILLHEFGHFAAAKLFKVRVNEFSVGMGPALWKRRRGDTLYAVRLLPIGGYTAMEGEDTDSEDDRAFCKKKVWQRMVVVVAGAAMNLVLGLVLMAILLATSGELVGTNVIHSMYDGAVSAQYGLQAGDRIVEIDGHRLWSPQDLTYLLSRSDDGVFDFVVERDGETVELPGVHFATEEVDGITLVHYDFSVVGEEPNFGNVFVHAFTESASVVRTVWLSIFDLVTGRFGLSQLAGPIGTMDIISDVTASAAAEGRAGDLLMLLAFITINLGVANLLPLPALDGGRLLFLVLEGIRRKPIPAKYEGYVHAAGMVLLLLLMLVVSLNDILRIARG